MTGPGMQVLISLCCDPYALAGAVAFRPALFSPDLGSHDGSVQPLTGLGVEELHLPGVELERHEVTGRKATPGWELAH
jgi:hypothetical protein